MVYSKENHLLYAGCGDNKIHTINLDNGKILNSFAGHTDFIHSMALSYVIAHIVALWLYFTLFIAILINYICSGKQLASGGEDGTVRLWDLRSKENTNILQPHLDGKAARPKLGKWIGAVDFTEDWLVCTILVVLVM